MRRRNPPSGNRDSDEILSDDEEFDQVTYDNDCSRNLESLYSNENKLPVLSRLESLTEKEQNLTSHAFEVNLKQINPSPLLGAWKLENISTNFANEIDGVKNKSNELIQSLSSNEHHGESGDDSISDEENAVLSKLSVTFGDTNRQLRYSRNEESQYQQGASMWSAVNEEVHGLATLPKKTESCSHIYETSETRQARRGDRRKAKPKISFRFPSHRGNISCSSSLKDGNGEPYKDINEGSVLHEKLGYGTTDNSIKPFANCQKESNEQPMVVATREERGSVSSMSELLEELQHKNGLFDERPNMLLKKFKAKETKTQSSRRRILHRLGSRILDDEDAPELPGGVLSSEDEDSEKHNLYITAEDSNEQTITDIFQEAFDRFEAEVPFSPATKPAAIGYHGRLQQVLQIEKDRNLEYIKDLQTGRRPTHDSGYMDVKILSRFLEAKLTVCKCLIDESSNQYASDIGKEKTIIFTSKICSNVELEIGNQICVQPPWKEVQVNEDEQIILCTYFSAVLP